MKLTVLAILTFLLVTQARADGMNVSLTAHDGLLVETDGEIVVIDAVYKVHEEWEGFSYDGIPDGLLERLKITEKPVSILSTHVHRDHFHPELVGGLLDGRDTVRAYGSPQVVESIKESYVNEQRIRDRLICIAHTACDAVHTSHGGLKISGISLTHTNADYDWLDNTAFLISDGSSSVLHLGDADLNTENLDKLASLEKDFDVVAVTYWYILDVDGLKKLMERLNPKRLALIHAPSDRMDQIRNYAESLGDARLFVPEVGGSIYAADQANP